MNNYQNSYELYTDMRKVILMRKPPINQRIYLGRIVDKLFSEKDSGATQLICSPYSNCATGSLKENKVITLPTIKIEDEDYELAQIAKWIINNPNFNYRLMKNQNTIYYDVEINHRLMVEENRNKLKLLINNIVQ